jgi:hypothetical protein
MVRHTGPAAASLFAVLAGSALTGCTAPVPDAAESPSTTQPSVESTPSAAPSPTTTPNAAPSPATTPECVPASGGVLNDEPLDVDLYEDMVDLGAREGANGAVSYAPDGTFASYVVAAGDFRDGIADRLCLGPHAFEALNAVRRGSVNSVDPTNEAYLTPLYVGDTLNLSPYTITSVGDVNGVVHSYETSFILPPQR